MKRNNLMKKRTAIRRKRSIALMLSAFLLSNNAVEGAYVYAQETECVEEEEQEKQSDFVQQENDTKEEEDVKENEDTKEEEDIKEDEGAKEEEDVKEDEDTKEEEDMKEDEDTKEEEDIKEDDNTAKAFHEEKTIGNTKIELDAPEGVLPDGTQVKVSLLTTKRSIEKVEQTIEDELEKNAKENETLELVGMKAYDITLLHDGKEIQPDTSAGEVSVKFSEISFQTEGENDVSFLKVFHIEEDKEHASEMDTNIDRKREEISFDTEHFSIYAIADVGGVITYDSGDSGECTLPAGDYTIEAKGAGGASSYETYYNYGGNGGYVSGRFHFDHEVTLSYVVGTGGKCHHGSDADQEGSNGTPGGGKGYLAPKGEGAASGGGGGYSAISNKGNYLIVAGGGGGGDTSSNRGGLRGGNGGSGGGMSGMNGENGSYKHPMVNVFYATGGGGGGYYGGKIHTGGTSYISPEALNSTMLEGQGGSGGSNIGMSGTGGTIKITWNLCGHGKESLYYESLQDCNNHKVICNACEEVVCEEVICSDEDEDGYCDLCGQLVPPFFRNNVEIEHNISYGSQDTTELQVDACILEDFTATLQWYEIKDGVAQPLQGETGEKLLIEQKRLNLGEHQYYCVMNFTGKVEGTRQSAIQTIVVDKAESYLQMEYEELTGEYGTGELCINYEVTADQEGNCRLINNQIHGGALKCISSDDAIMEVMTEETANNQGIIHVTLKKAGTAQINLQMSEGNNYKAPESKIIQVTVEKAGITDFRFISVPKKLKYGDSENVATYRYWGKDEPADGVLNVTTQNISSGEEPKVLTAVLREDGQSIAITPVNAGKARIVLSVEQEGNNYKKPAESGAWENVLHTQEIEVAKAEGSILFDSDLKENRITLYKKHNASENADVRSIPFIYNANLDKNPYGKGEIQLIMPEKQFVSARVKDTKDCLELEPLCAGEGEIILTATEGVNYTECRQVLSVKVIDCAEYGDMTLDFDFTGDGGITVNKVHQNTQGTMPEEIFLPDHIIIDGESIKINDIKPDAIDESIRIVTEPGSVAESYAKENGNPLTIKTDRYSYDVIKKDGEWVAENYIPTIKSPVLNIPSIVDGYPVIGINPNAITSKTEQIVLESTALKIEKDALQAVIKNIKVIRPQDSFTLNKKADGDFVIEDYLVKDKLETIDVPEKIMGYSIASVSRQLTDDNTQTVILHGSVTKLPDKLNWRKEIKIVVVKDSDAERSAFANAFWKIQYLPLGGIEVKLNANAASFTGNKIDPSKVMIIGYWDRERTKQGEILWEDLTTVPKDLTVHKQGGNKYIVGYYDAFSYFVINGYIPQTDKKHTHSNSGSKPAIQDMDDVKAHINEIVDNVSEQDLEKLVDTNTIHLGKDTVQSLYHNGLDRMESEHKNQLLKSELTELSQEDIRQITEQIEEGVNVDLQEQGYLENMTEENDDGQAYDSMLGNRKTFWIKIWMLQVVMIALLITVIYIYVKMKVKRKGETWDEYESDLR